MNKHGLKHFHFPEIYIKEHFFLVKIGSVTGEILLALSLWGGGGGGGGVQRHFLVKSYLY